MALFKNYFNICLSITMILYLPSFVFYDIFSEIANQTEISWLTPLSLATINSSSISNLANNSLSISKIDIEVGKHPYDALYNPSNNSTYVTNPYSKTISIVSDNKVIETISLNFNPWNMAYDPHNSNVYVSTFFNNNSILILNNNNNISKTIDGFSHPNDIAYNPDTKSMYITNTNLDNYNTSSSISVINVTDNSLSSPLLLEKNYLPTKIIYNPINHYMYITEGSYIIDENKISKNRLLVLDVLNNTIVDEISLPGLYSNAITYNPFNGYVYVGSSNMGEELTITENESNNDKDTNLDKTYPIKNITQGVISIINSTTNTIVGTIPNIGYEPSDLIYNPKNNMLLMTDLYTNSVKLIDSKTNNVITTIAVGSNPTSLAYNYDNGMVYVVNSNMFEYNQNKSNHTVSIIDFSYGQNNSKYHSSDSVHFG